MKQLYDVAIVGAGPAGAVFARQLVAVRPDWSVLLIDGQTEQNKKPCGGLLSPDAQKNLAELGLTLPNEVLADPQIFSVETMDLVARRTRFYQRHYLNMDRYRFDRWLLSLVPPSVTVLAGRVLEVERTDGFLLTLSGGAQARARFLVGADGGGSIVRRKLYGRMPYQYVSIQEWFEDRGERVPHYSCIFDPKTSDSCSWTIRKDGCVIFGGSFKRDGCRDAFAEQKARLEDYLNIHFGEPIRREACLVTSPRHFRDLVCGGDGYFLLGEAAGMISASSFEGFSSAFHSARALAEAFRESEHAPTVLKKYKKNTRGHRLEHIVKMAKRCVLCSPFLRRMILASGVTAIKDPTLFREKA